MTLRRRLRGAARGAVTLIVSFGAIAASAAYVTAPTQTVLAMSFRSATAPHVAPHREVIYGRAVSRAGQPIRGARIAIGKTTRGRFTLIASVTTGADGTARLAVSVPAGSYVIKVTVRQGRTVLTAAASVKLAPEHAYKLTIRQARPGVLIVLPVRGY